MKMASVEHRNHLRLLAIVVLSCLAAGRLSTQAPTAADGPWAGWIRCQVTAQAQGYSDQQTHTWIISGGAPRVEGVFRIFPATWSVVGVGSLQRTQGANTVTAQWATNGQGPSAPVAVWMRGDGRLVFTLRHDQLRAQGGFTGYRYYTVDGKRQTPEQLAAETYEYRFAAIDAATGNTISGSSTVASPPANAFLPQPGSTGSASCTWQFGVGAAAPAPPAPLQAQATPTPGSSGPTPTQTPPLQAVAVPGGRADAGPPTGGSSRTPLPDATGRTAELVSPLTCQMPGPVIESPVRVTPAAAYLRWAASPGAVGYTVSRNDIGMLTPAPIQATTFTNNAPLDYRVSYTYTITTQYSVGCGTSRVTVTAPRPGTPTISSVSATNGNMATKTGGVRIKWDLPGSDATGYLVLGPGIPQNGQEILANQARQIARDPVGVSAGYQIDISGVPPGTQTWLIAPFWNTPAGRMIDVGTGARATARVGFFRVLITGVRADHETVDNSLSLDGRGDEIYVAAAAYLSGELVAIGNSSVYGDTSSAPTIDIGGIGIPPRTDRIRAGTASPTGGIRTGDAVPFPDPSLPVGPPSSTMLPFVVWEGWLGGGTGLLVKPTIWESDGDLTNFNQWSEAMRGWNSTSETPAEREQALSTFDSRFVGLQTTQLQQDAEYRRMIEEVKESRRQASTLPGPGYDRAIGGVRSSPWVEVYAQGIASSQGLVDALDGQPGTTFTMTATRGFTDPPEQAGRYTLFVLLQQIP